MTEQFRITRALSLSFKVWFRNLLPFSLLAAVVYSPAVIWLATIHLDDLESISSRINASNECAKPILLMFGLSTLLPPLLTYRIIQEVNGTTVSIWTSIKLGMRGFLPAVLLGALALGCQPLPAGELLSSVLTCFYFVATPTAITERRNPIAALSRSAAITRGRRWGIFGLTLLLDLMLGRHMLIWSLAASVSDDFGSALRTSSIIFIVVIGVSRLLGGITQAVSYALLRQDKDRVGHTEIAQVFE